MKRMWMRVAVLGAAGMLLPCLLGAQVDPNAPPPAGPQGTVPPPGPSTTTSPATMRETLGAPGQTGQQMADKQFLRAAAAGGLAEVKLGMLAVAKGGPEVKDFGQKMVDDHTAIDKDMAVVADALGVMLPKKMSKDDQAEYDKLNGLSGDEFDKEYILYMAKAHRQDLHDFRTEASVAADPELEAEVTKAALVIRQHLMMVTKLAGDKGVVLPPRPPSRPAPPAGQ
jgi:putative membrane protein